METCSCDFLTDLLDFVWNRRVSFKNECLNDIICIIKGNFRKSSDSVLKTAFVRGR